MGNCHTGQWDDGDFKDDKKKNVSVLTFAGPNAMSVAAEDPLQATFADPIYFTNSEVQK